MTENPVSKRIVVGVDGSEPSREALRWAARLATLTGGAVEAVMAWSWPANYGWVAVPSEWNPEEDSMKALRAMVDEILGEDSADDLTLTVAEGEAAAVLIDCAKDAEMLIVGTRGLGGLSGLLLGSVSHKCAEHATCPVLLVR